MPKIDKHSKKKKDQKSPLSITKSTVNDGKARAKAKNEMQRNLTYAIENRAPELGDLFQDPELAAVLNSHLPLRTRVTLSGMGKSLNKGTRDSLYNNHASALPYKTTAPAKKKSDGEEASAMFEEARKAVNLAYQLVVDYLNGEEIILGNYGISGDRWKDFLNKLSAYKDSTGKTMHPSTVSGYIIEDVTTHILTSWNNNDLEAGEYDFQDTKIMGNKSRPDITSFTENKQRVSMDITSQASSGHILKKKGNWLKFPHVAELLYPQINFNNPGAINVQMTDAERAEILKKPIQEQVEIEGQKYASFIAERTKYYKDTQILLDKLLCSRHKPSERKLQTFQDANRNVEIDIEDDEYVIQAQSFTSYREQQGFDPYENMPKSPAHYSMDIEEEDDLIHESKKTKYTSVSNYQSIIKKKFNS